MNFTPCRPVWSHQWKTLHSVTSENAIPTLHTARFMQRTCLFWSAAREQGASRHRHGQGYFCRSNLGSSEKGVEGVRLENYRQPSLFATPKRPDMYILFSYVPFEPLTNFTPHSYKGESEPMNWTLINWNAFKVTTNGRRKETRWSNRNCSIIF